MSTTLHEEELFSLAGRLFPRAGFGKGALNTAKPVVGIAAADHAATLTSAWAAQNAGLADFILFGPPETVEQRAAEAGVPLDEFQIEACDTHEDAAEMAADAAAEGRIGILMKGAVHTAEFTRAFLHKQRGLVHENRLISHVAAFSVPGYHKPFLLTDGAINIAPDLMKKISILQNVLDTARDLGIAEPAAACICPVETVNPKIPSTMDAAELARLQNADKTFGTAVVEGPMALDAAMSTEAAAVKGISGRVPGHPDVLFMPCLDAGNALYKAFAGQPGALAAGIIAGLKIPVVLTSRSDSEITRVLSLCMALAAAVGRQ